MLPETLIHMVDEEGIIMNIKLVKSTQKVEIKFVFGWLELIVQITLRWRRSFTKLLWQRDTDMFRMSWHYVCFADSKAPTLQQLAQHRRAP